MYSIEKYLSDLTKVLGDSLKSVFIYGSAARFEQKNNINLMMILDSFCGDDIRACAKITKKWVCSKNPMPVFITYDEWKSSSDTYALEYSDIVDFNKIIYGKDYISQIAIKRDDLRLQCEREIKSLLMKLRAFYILNSNSKMRLKVFLLPCCNTFMTIFRGILRLNEIPVKNDDNYIITTAANVCGISEEVFQAILDNKTGVSKIKNKNLYNVLDNLISELEILLCYVNSI